MSASFDFSRLESVVGFVFSNILVSRDDTSAAAGLVYLDDPSMLFFIDFLDEAMPRSNRAPPK
jgi:hypothetical protein